MITHFRRRKIRVGVAVVLVVLTTGTVTAFIVLRSISNGVRDAYAVEWVSGMVNDSMDSRGGAWPRGWEDLRQPYEDSVKQVGRPWTFEELRDRVEVDWTANPKVLAGVEAKDGVLPFRVIWLNDGRSIYWAGEEPNRVVLDHLRERAKATTTRP